MILSLQTLKIKLHDVISGEPGAMQNKLYNKSFLLFSHNFATSALYNGMTDKTVDDQSCTNKNVWFVLSLDI